MHLNFRQIRSSASAARPRGAALAFQHDSPGFVSTEKNMRDARAITLDDLRVRVCEPREEIVRYGKMRSQR